ncbi:MAG: endonuclease/exonuclease/phosphatase family protein [Verrucomicrobiota bacterium]
MISKIKQHFSRLFALLWLLSSTLAGAQVFRVATFNVENYLDTPSSQRPAKSSEGKARVRESILVIKPDVIALEEIGSTNALFELQSALKTGGLDLPYWDLITGYDTNIHVSVLGRFPIVARRPHTNESFLLEGRRMQVSRGFAEMDIQVNPNFKFTLIAVHLKSRRPDPRADEEEWRYEEASALRRVIDARLAENPDQKLVVLGDFNDLKDSKPMRTIMGRGRTRLFDTRPAERNGDDPTRAGKGHDSRNVAWTHYYAVEDVYSRIDYILLSHGMERQWLGAETYVLSLPNWGLASDHRPLVAGFTAEPQ